MLTHTSATQTTQHTGSTPIQQLHKW